MWLFRAWKTAPPVLALSQDFYSLRAMDILGKERPMSEFKGQVLLISNVASKCGLTAQHIDEFKQLKEKFGGEGFEVSGERRVRPVASYLPGQESIVKLCHVSPDFGLSHSAVQQAGRDRSLRHRGEVRGDGGELPHLPADQRKRRRLASRFPVLQNALR